MFFNGEHELSFTVSFEWQFASFFFFFLSCR